jgi:creatinine amidohydrolase
VEAPKTQAVVRAIDAEASHASWTENFPWTRLAGVVVPDAHKPRTERLSDDPADVRKRAGDGSFGGWYERPDADVMRVWRTGVEETREVLAALR